jgi:hypothetical protein
MDKKKIEDGAHLMYVKDGQLYPVILDESQYTLLQSLVAGVFSPLKLAPYPQKAMTFTELKEKGLIK